MHDVTMLVRHNLKFDVVRIDDEFFDINIGVAKSILCFHPRRVERRYN